MLRIQVPIWKTRSVGVATENLNDEISIDYKKPDGKLLYPYVYKVNMNNQYPIKWNKGGHNIHEIPIVELDVVSRRAE